MKTLNVELMKQLKIRILLVLIFLIFSIFILTFNLSAQEREKERGYKGRISKERMLSKFSKGEIVEGYIIKGVEIIEIIKETDFEIKINTSIIEDGLDFGELAVPLEKENLPKDWNEKEKDAYIKLFHATTKNILIVKNRISIIDSEIRIKKGKDYSIMARVTLFHESIDFSRTTFSGMTRFDWATFSGMAIFDRAIFSGMANFNWATFSGIASFDRATFNYTASFYWATFIKLAYFKRVSFFGRLDAAHAVIKEYADFRESKIRMVNFKSTMSPTILEGRIDFRNVIISEAHFQDITFERDVDFSDAKFGIPLIIVKLEKLPQGLEFSDSLKDKIHYEVRAKLLVFTGFMTESEKEELAGLSEDTQYREAIEQLFREYTSGPFAVVFRFVKFESDAYFLRTKFSGDTALERVTFKKEANFTDADFKGKKSINKQRFSLSYLNVKNMLIKWNQFPNPKSWVSETRIKSFEDIVEELDEVKKKGEKEVELEPLSQVLKGLEANFRNQKQLSDANNAYYYKKAAEFKEERNSKAFLKWFPNQALWFFWWLSCGYGTKILWMLWWLIFSDLLFAMIYSVKNNLKKKTHPETKGEFTFKQRLFDFPRLYLSEAKPLDMIKSEFAKKFINALRFSSVILFKVGYRDTTISGKILGIDCKYIVWIEWLLGFYLLACLTVTMSNTIPIINSLIRGIF